MNETPWGFELELKGGAGLEVPYLCEEEKRAKKRITWAERGACLFQGYGLSVAHWVDGQPIGYRYNSIEKSVMLVAHEVVSDGEHEWVIGLLTPVQES